MIDHLNWDDLRVFLEVARTGNLAETARRLKVDHSTVSRRVAQLESTLGAGLFARGRAGFKLTELGQRILPRAEAMESAAIGVKAAVGAETDGVGLVRLATMEGIASFYLAGRMPELKRYAPAIKLELVTSPQVIHVNRREADLFLSFFKPPGQGLVSEAIGEFKLGLYAAPDYLARRGRPASVADLSGHDFVSYIDDLILVDAVRWLRDVVEEVETSFTSNSMIAQTFAAAAGMGLVLLPRFALRPGLSLEPVLADVVVTRQIWLNVHQDLQFTPRIKTVAAFLKRQVRLDMAAGAL